MKKKPIIFIILVCVIQILMLSQIFAVSKTVAIVETDNGKTITLAVGDVLQLSLITNLSTGYTWQYTQQPDLKVLKQTNHYYISTVIPPLPGSPQMEYWIYSAVGAGKTVISLKYSRSWETIPPLKTFSVNIVVK